MKCSLSLALLFPRRLPLHSGRYCQNDIPYFSYTIVNTHLFRSTLITRHVFLASAYKHDNGALSEPLTCLLIRFRLNNKDNRPYRALDLHFQETFPWINRLLSEEAKSRLERAPTFSKVLKQLLNRMMIDGLTIRSPLIMYKYCDFRGRRSAAKWILLKAHNIRHLCIYSNNY